MPTEDCSSRSTSRMYGPHSSARGTRSHPPTTFERAARHTVQRYSTRRPRHSTRTRAQTARRRFTSSTRLLATLARSTLLNAWSCRTPGSSTRMCRLEGILRILPCWNQGKNRDGDGLQRGILRGAPCEENGKAQWTFRHVSSTISSQPLKQHLAFEEPRCQGFALFADGRSWSWRAGLPLPKSRRVPPLYDPPIRYRSCLSVISTHIA